MGRKCVVFLGYIRLESQEFIVLNPFLAALILILRKIDKKSIENTKSKIVGIYCSISRRSFYLVYVGSEILTCNTVHRVYLCCYVWKLQYKKNQVWSMINCLGSKCWSRLCSWTAVNRWSLTKGVPYAADRGSPLLHVRFVTIVKNWN